MKLAIRILWLFTFLAIALTVLAVRQGWLGESDAVLLSALVAAAAALIRLEILRRVQARHAQGLEKSMLTLATGLDSLRDRVKEGRPEGEMLREMRILQTLLARIIAHREPQAQAASKTEGALPDDEAGQQSAPPGQPSLRDAVLDAFTENRVDLYLQPIVMLPSRRTAHFECFSRVRDASGTIVFPVDYLPVAEEEGLIGTLDNLLLFRCIQLVRKLGHRQPGLRFFVNISPHSLLDAEFFGQFVDFMVANRELAARLIFEFPYRAFIDMPDDSHSLLMDLAGAGYAFSLDNAEGGSPDLSLLHRHHVRFIKIEAEALLSGETGSPALIAEARELDISLVATHIESERATPELLDLDIGLAQGYLFDRPRPAADRAAEL